MALISGTNKSVSLHQNVAQGITVHNDPHQEGIKNVDSAQPQNSYSTGLIKVMAALDDFKYGFPSQELATVPNKWWGNSDTDEGADINWDKAKVDEHGDKEVCKGDSNVTSQGTDMLTATRRRAAEEGREALKLGVFRGYGAKKLGKRERMLLLKIFKSSLPRSWLCN